MVRPGRVLEVTVPRGTGSRALRRFIGEHEAWIAERLDEARERAARSHTLGLAEPGSVVLAGERIPVVCDAGGADRAYARDGGVSPCRAPTPPPRSSAGTGARPGGCSRRPQHGRHLASGLAYARIAVRDQRTRWGSCSTRGTLSFSWRLALAPPEVLDYVVVHELLHLREHNHSRAFWRLLDVHRPGWPTQAELAPRARRGAAGLRASVIPREPSTRTP